MTVPPPPSTVIGGGGGDVGVGCLVGIISTASAK